MWSGLDNGEERYGEKKNLRMLIIKKLLACIVTMILSIITINIRCTVTAVVKSSITILNNYLFLHKQ